ncbi:MAG TPA: hypothetical protein VEG38_06155, partial [Acidimicrobiia bacterium]|nr:hypothetical protein [Acidimicrobiia bacterium]
MIAVALCTLGVLGIGCNADSDQETSAAGGDTTSTGAGPAPTTAPPAPRAVAVAYTRTSLAGPSSPPPEKFRAEVSLDGASFRMTADDGSRDFAYDAAGGRAYEWSRSQEGAPESAALTTGLASGGPDHHGLSDGPHDSLAVLVRALGRAGDARVTTVTSHGRPAWHYDGPMAGDQFGSEPLEDHVVTDIDQASGVTLLQVISGKGKVTRRFEATSIEDRPAEDRSRYRPDPPATADVRSDDHGFRAMTLDEVASAAGYDVLVPGAVPAGFELGEVLFDADQPLRTGAEALNPAPARVTSLRWRGPNGASFTVTLRPENGDPAAKREGAVWSDPFGSEGTELTAEKVSIPVDGRRPLQGELFVAAPAAPHLWGITGDLVVTIDGDLDPAGLRSVAGSLRKHPEPAATAASTKCQPIGFTPNSDDVAADITATGLDCAEASALVRRAREQHDPVAGRRF